MTRPPGEQMTLEILIPYWGDPRLMKQAVGSVLAQSSSAWRLTIIDDAYPDRTVQEWVASIADERVDYQRKPVNEGIVANFRSCLRAASQPLMTMMGADDRLLPNYVEDVLRAHDEFPTASIIQPGVEVIDADGDVSGGMVEFAKQRIVRPRTSRWPQLLAGEPLATSLLHGNWLYWPSLAFRTEAIQQHDFPARYPILLDLAIVLDLVFAGEELLALRDVAFQYRRHSASLSSAATLDGSRFSEEHAFYAEASRRAAALGWGRAARAASLRPTSRIHAALGLPRSLLGRDVHAVRSLARHAFGR